MGEAAEPIKDLKQLEKMKEELKLIPHGEIFYLIFEFGLNSGLRISDILRLKVNQVLDDYVSIREQKTGKLKKFPINEHLRILIKKYLKIRKLKCTDFLFKSTKYFGLTNVNRSSCNRAFKRAAQNAGITNHVSTHTMRKTFGYHYYKRTKDLVLLQKIFNHSSSHVTLRYLGIDQEEIDKAYMNLVYSESETTENTDENKVTNTTDINALPDKYIIYSKMAALEKRIHKRLEAFEDRLISTLDYALKKDLNRGKEYG